MRWIRHAEFKIIFTIIIIISIHNFFYHQPCSNSTVIQPFTQAFVQLQSYHPDITSIDNASSQGSEQEDRNRRLKSALSSSSSSSSLSAAVSHDYDHQLLRYIDIVYATDLADTQLHYLVRSINSIVQTTMTSIRGGGSNETINETSSGGDNSSSETTTIYRDVFSLRIHVFYEAARISKVSSSGRSPSRYNDDNCCDVYDDYRLVYAMIIIDHMIETDMTEKIKMKIFEGHSILIPLHQLYIHSLERLTMRCV